MGRIKGFLEQGIGGEGSRRIDWDDWKDSTKKDDNESILDVVKRVQREAIESYLKDLYGG